MKAMLQNNFLLMLLVSSHCSLGQTDSVRADKFSLRGCHFGAFIKPTFTGTLKEMDGSLERFGEYTEWYRYDKKNNGIGSSVGIGLNFNIRIYKSFRVNFGIESDALKYQTKTIDTLYQTISTSYYPFPGSSQTKKIVNRSQVQHMYALISLPMSFEYFFHRDKDLFFSFGLGGTATLVTRQSTVLRIFDTQAGESPTKNFNPYEVRKSQYRYRIFLNANVALNYALSDRSFVSLKPYFRLQVGPESVLSTNSSGNSPFSSYASGNSNQLYYFGCMLMINL